MNVESRKTMRYLHSLAELFPDSCEPRREKFETHSSRSERSSRLLVISYRSYVPDIAAASVFKRREYFTSQRALVYIVRYLHRDGFYFRYKIERSRNCTSIIREYVRARKKVIAARRLFYILLCFMFSFALTFTFSLAFILSHFCFSCYRRNSKLAHRDAMSSVARCVNISRREIQMNKF